MYYLRIRTPTVKACLYVGVIPVEVDVRRYGHVLKGLEHATSLRGRLACHGWSPAAEQSSCPQTRVQGLSVGDAEHNIRISIQFLELVQRSGTNQTVAVMLLSRRRWKRYDYIT